MPNYYLGHATASYSIALSFVSPSHHKSHCKNANMPCRFMRPPLAYRYRYRHRTPRDRCCRRDPPAARAHIRKMLVSPWADSRRRQRDRLAQHHHISLFGLCWEDPEGDRDTDRQRVSAVPVSGPSSFQPWETPYAGE